MTIRPTARFLLGHPAHLIALGFGTGLVPVAPGTIGTLLAVPLYLALNLWLPPLSLLGVVAILFGIGIWACDRTGRDLGVADHRSMNWDEAVAFMLVLLLTPDGWDWQAAAFLAFRFFDVVKPEPIRYFEKTVKGGLGVMFDDVVAAAYTLLSMAAVAFVLRGLGK